jgi:hypothetical protein
LLFPRVALIVSSNFDGLVKSPSVPLGAGLPFDFVVAEGRGGSPSRPRSGNPAGCPYHWICAPCIAGASGARPIRGVRPDVPTIETIVPVTFYEIINFESGLKIYMLKKRASDKNLLTKKLFFLY